MTPVFSIAKRPVLLIFFCVANGHLIQERGICSIKDSLKALKDIPGSVKDCVEATAEKGLNVLKDIKCPFTALSAFQDVKECIKCTHIGECDYGDTGILNPTKRSCGGPNGVITHTGPGRCAQYNATAEVKPGDRLWKGDSLYRMHCGDNRVFMAENRCYFECAKCTAQCGDTCPAATNPVNRRDALSDFDARSGALQSSTHLSPIMVSRETSKEEALQARQALHARTLEVPNYARICAEKDDAIVVTNSNAVQDLQHWRIGKVSYATIPDKESCQCDHILELFELPSFFNLQFGGAWGYRNPVAQDFWMSVMRNSPGAENNCYLNRLRDILNDRDNLIYVDGRVNQLKLNALKRSPHLETWEDRALMGTFQYLHYIAPSYYRTAQRLAQLFDEVNGFTGNEPQSFSNAMAFYTTGAMMWARNEIDIIIGRRGGASTISNPRYPPPNIGSATPEDVGVEIHPDWLPYTGATPVRKREQDAQIAEVNTEIKGMSEYMQKALVGWDSTTPPDPDAKDPPKVHCNVADPIWQAEDDIHGNLPLELRLDDGFDDTQG